MKPVTVTQYEIADGQRFDTQEEALRAEADAELGKWAEDMGLCMGGEWSQDMVLTAITENIDRLLPILVQFSSTYSISKGIGK